MTVHSLIDVATSTGSVTQSLISAGISGYVLTSNGTGSAATFQAIPSGGISSVNVQTFTTSGTYTPTSGMSYCTIELVGGGGGGGGCANCPATNVSIGGSGGGGGYARKTATAAAIGASQTVTIGAGGTGGIAGDNAGTTGGTTSVGSIVSATGGVGGSGSAAAGSIYQPGSAGGTGSSGDINISGQQGGNASSIYAAGVGIYCWNWGGGASQLGFGAPSLSVYGNYGAGANGQSYGGGATGGSASDGGSGTAGGSGSPGIVTITEYIA